VPGITAALAASAEIAVSLTRRGVSRHVVFVTPRIGEEQTESDWADTVLHADTAAIYMGASQAEAIAATLIARGRAPATPVALVENASLPSGSVRYGVLAELASLARAGGDGPVVILLGEVLREKLAALCATSRRSEASAVAA
ncbi:MAG: SAM-dependent methyltransferase, partial [Burkholderiales bacterium]